MIFIHRYNYIFKKIGVLFIYTHLMANLKPGNSKLKDSKDDQKSNENFGTGRQSRIVQLDDEYHIRQAFEMSPEKGCEVLFLRYHKLLCSQAVRFVYSREVAEDLVGEVFCNFWEKKTYEHIDTSFRYYLLQTVRNKAFNYLRLEFKPFKNLEDLEVDRKYLEGIADSTPEQIIIKQETLQRLKVTIEQLPPQCRKVFMMNRFDGKRYQEIATEMGLSEKTVEAHLAKALSYLKKGLRSYLLLGIALIFIR